MAGSLCISIDLELAWGVWDKPSAATADYHKRCAEHEGAIVDRLLALFEKHEVCATWAIVGRLLERDGEAVKSTRYGERIWYAPDIIEKIANARVAQEVGSHSHAHVYFEETAREAVRDDLLAAKAVHAQHGLDFTSFVFPRNQVAHLDVLREAGIQVFRSADQGWFIDVKSRFGKTAGRVANLMDKVMPIPPTAVSPERQDGLTDLPGSMLLLARNGLRRMVHPRAAIMKARFGLDAARRTGHVFHLWFHPSNFYYETDQQFAVLDDILARADRMRRHGQLEIRPMRSFAA